MTQKKSTKLLRKRKIEIANMKKIYKTVCVVNLQLKICPETFLNQLFSNFEINKIKDQPIKQQQTNQKN